MKLMELRKAIHNRHLAIGTAQMVQEMMVLNQALKTFTEVSKALATHIADVGKDG